MPNPSPDEIKALLAECLEVDPERIDPNATIASVEEWTSLAWLAIMSSCDQRWGAELSAREIRGWQTVAEVIAGIQAAVARASA